VYKESRYCASCHEGIVFGVRAYETYSEWLESPAKRRGQQCQDCHMAPTGQMTNIAPGHGGVERDSRTLASHYFPGGAELVGKSVSVRVQSAQVPQGRKVDVEIVAERVGHRVPTGFPDRQLILVVEGNGLLLTGQRLPKIAGKWQGTPGVLFAKQLFRDDAQKPLPFWLPIANTVDTRLVPEQPARHSFVFVNTVTRVNVRVFYRRFWQHVADERGWGDNDRLIVDQTHELN
jgi:hypothetical protein